MKAARIVLLFGIEVEAAIAMDTAEEPQISVQCHGPEPVCIDGPAFSVSLFEMI